MVEIELELDKEVLWKLFLLAHEKDITLNQLINNILKEYVDKYKEEKTGTS